MGRPLSIDYVPLSRRREEEQAREQELEQEYDSVFGNVDDHAAAAIVPPEVAQLPATPPQIPPAPPVSFTTPPRAPAEPAGALARPPRAENMYGLDRPPPPPVSAPSSKPLFANRGYQKPPTAPEPAADVPVQEEQRPSMDQALERDRDARKNRTLLEGVGNIARIAFGNNYPVHVAVDDTQAQDQERSLDALLAQSREARSGRYEELQRMMEERAASRAAAADKRQAALDAIAGERRDPHSPASVRAQQLVGALRPGIDEGTRGGLAAEDVPVEQLIAQQPRPPQQDQAALEELRQQNRMELERSRQQGRILLQQSMHPNRGHGGGGGMSPEQREQLIDSAVTLGLTREEAEAELNIGGRRGLARVSGTRAGSPQHRGQVVGGAGQEVMPGVITYSPNIQPAEIARLRTGLTQLRDGRAVIDRVDQVAQSHSAAERIASPEVQAQLAADLRDMQAMAANAGNSGVVSVGEIPIINAQLPDPASIRQMTFGQFQAKIRSWRDHFDRAARDNLQTHGVDDAGVEQAVSFLHTGRRPNPGPRGAGAAPAAGRLTVRNAAGDVVGHIPDDPAQRAIAEQNGLVVDGP